MRLVSHWNSRCDFLLRGAQAGVRSCKRIVLAKTRVMRIRGGRAMTIRVVRLGSTRGEGEGLRIGTVRRPPRGIPKSSFASGNWYDVWFPILAPSVETLKLGKRLPRPHSGLPSLRSTGPKCRFRKPAMHSHFSRRCLITVVFPLDAIARMNRTATARCCECSWPSMELKLSKRAVGQGRTGTQRDGGFKLNLLLFHPYVSAWSLQAAE